MEFDDTPGAVLVAAALAAVLVTMPTNSIAPVSVVAAKALNPCLTRMRSPILGRASPRDAGHCSCRASRPLLTPCALLTSPNCTTFTRYFGCFRQGCLCVTSVQKQPPSLVLP